MALSFLQHGECPSARSWASDGLVIAIANLREVSERTEGAVRSCELTSGRMGERLDDGF